MSAPLTYVYCLVRAARRPSLGRVPDGMPDGQPVRLLEVPALASSSGRLRHWLVVSSVPERMYGEPALERGLQRLEWVGRRALAHEAVVERFLPAAAVLPMQLFALFKGDARAVEHIVGDRRRVRRILARIQGQVEWGLRVTWNPAAAGDQTRSRARGPTRGARRTVSGAEYLARKRDLRDAVQVQRQRARAASQRLYRAIAREAAAARRRTEVEQAAPGSLLLLDAAFLVPPRRAAAFRAAVRRQAAPLKRSGMAVSLTGPWPAYNFI